MVGVAEGTLNNDKPGWGRTWGKRIIQQPLEKRKSLENVGLWASNCKPGVKHLCLPRMVPADDGQETTNTATLPSTLN